MPVSPYGVVFLILRILLYRIVNSPAHTFMLPLEVMGPGDSLSTSLATTLSGEMPVGECPGRRHGDGGLQLRPDGGGVRPSARGR